MSEHKIKISDKDNDSLKNAIENAIQLASENRVGIDIEFDNEDIKYKGIKINVNGKLNIKCSGDNND
ncbi:MAG: hypothetical protein K0B02_05115 [DPANN group archaeon]|nr:hypothetical protein [DPANN group archaeon]